MIGLVLDPWALPRVRQPSNMPRVVKQIEAI